MFLLGESTLALDEEMLQVLDAVDPVKPADNNARPATVNRDAREESASSSAFAPSRSLAPVAHNKRESDRVTSQGPSRAPSSPSWCSSDGKRPGWTADCKDLAQKLLFSEDLEEAERAQRGPKSGPSVPVSVCNNGQEIKNSQQAGSSNM